jgi:single-stranded-DNA-specific exonuclease
MAKQWVVKKSNAERIPALDHFPEFIRPLLFTRGLISKESINRFLNPSFAAEIHSPCLMSDMKEGVGRIKQAIANNEKVIIFADYDADGVPGAAILSSFFKAINHANIEVYIPNRHTEAYGLKAEHIAKFKEQGVKLIITIDCGITAVEAVAEANKQNIDVIITDHHLPPDVLPKAHAIINPKKINCEYPFKELCGAAVAYKVVCALDLDGDFDLPIGFTKWLLDLVAVATVSDMMR